VITLRTVRPEDRDFLFSVYASTRTEEMAMVPWDDAQKAGFLTQQFQAQTTYWDEQYPEAQRSIVEIDGVPAGRFYVERWPTEIRLIDIALLPEFRRKGAGTELLKVLFAEASASGKTVTIHVEIFNPARALYERLGFVDRGERGLYVLMEWKSPVEARSVS
jgi:ribosomal protein S18 acetylase RimI-like enzyme